MIKQIVFVLVIGIVWSLPAHAFEKSEGAAPQKSKSSGSVAVELSEKRTKKNEEASGGLVFPGLGSLGVLPKLDFGLELLYGDNQPRVLEPEDNDVETDGLRIKGTLKHRF